MPQGLSSLRNTRPMLIKTSGIVFKTKKYGESSLIVDIYTEEKGITSAMTLADILRYANVSLDERWTVEEDSQGRSPLLRTTGVGIEMQAYVHSRRWGVGGDRGIYVDISFSYFPGWTSQGWVTMGRIGGVTTRQYQYGVGLTIKTDGGFTVFDPMVMIMYFVIQGAILGLASMAVLSAIGFCFAQKSLYVESSRGKLRPAASAAHFLMQALLAGRIFRDVDESGNGTVSPRELIDFFRKHIGGSKVVADSVLAEVITELFENKNVFRGKRFHNDADVENDSLSLKEFLAVFCGGSNLGEAMYCMDLDARHKKRGKNGDVAVDLAGTLQGPPVRLDFPGSDRALPRVAQSGGRGERADRQGGGDEQRDERAGRQGDGGEQQQRGGRSDRRADGEQRRRRSEHAERRGGEAERDERDERRDGERRRRGEQADQRGGREHGDPSQSSTSARRMSSFNWASGGCESASPPRESSAVL